MQVSLVKNLHTFITQIWNNLITFKLYWSAILLQYFDKTILSSFCGAIGESCKLCNPLKILKDQPLIYLYLYNLYIYISIYKSMSLCLCLSLSISLYPFKLFLLIKVTLILLISSLVNHFRYWLMPSHINYLHQGM